MKPKHFQPIACDDAFEPSPFIRPVFCDGEVVIAKLENGRMRAGYWLDRGIFSFPVDSRGDGIDGVVSVGRPS